MNVVVFFAFLIFFQFFFMNSIKKKWREIQVVIYFFCVILRKDGCFGYYNFVKNIIRKNFFQRPVQQCVKSISKVSGNG